MSAVSVALCTYNGERYLPAQLESIARQSRLPDELVVCDDGSKDATITQVESFARTVSFPVRLVRNARNLGSNQNFEQAIRLCEGEFIFLSDQDDWWHPRKVDTMLTRFAAHPATDALFSDGDVIDAQSRPVDRTLWESVGFDAASQSRTRLEGFHRFLETRYCVTGAALAFRSRLRVQILPFPVHLAFMFHDSWIARVASVNGSLESVPERLISYREHAAQQVGFRSKSTVEHASGVKPTRRQRLQAAWTESEALYRELLSRCGEQDGRLEGYRRTAAQKKFRAELPSPRLARLRSVIGRLIRGGYRGTVTRMVTQSMADILFPL